MAPQPYFWPGDLDDIEDIQNYRPGGFHPVHIGDIIRDEYRILHKLGCGGFSTVWLARVLTDQRLCALKILAANAPSDELDSMLYLAKKVGSHPNVSSLHDHFTIVGPNGPHRCLVLPVLGPSLKHIQKLKLPTAAARGAARQIAHGLAHIHAAGVCHSDLTHANVLLALRDVDRWTDLEVYQHFGPPKIAPLRRIDGSIPQPTGPRQITEAISFDTIDPELLSGDICIIDFGLSFRTKSPPPGIPGTPRSFLAPELCFGLPRSPSNDVWSLGCLIFELYSTRVLFPLVFDRLDIIIGTIVDTLGQLPSQWEGHFVNQEERVFETGQKDFWYDPSFKPGRPLDRQIIEKCPGIPEDQKPLFLQFLLGTLCLDPVHRLSALEIAAHSWFSQGGDSAEKS